MLGLSFTVFEKHACVNLFRGIKRFLGLFAEKLSATPITSWNNSIVGRLEL